MIIRDKGVLEVSVPSAARAASGNSGPMSGYDDAESLRIQLNVSAFTVAAGNTLDLVVEDTMDDGTSWNVIGTFAQRVGVGREVINITQPFADTIRFRWTVGGAANPTFEVRTFVQ